MQHRRIDVHHHMMPSAWLERAATVDPHLAALVPWTPDTSLRSMDSLGTERAVLSLTTPGISVGDPGTRAAFTRELNEQAADITAARPDRFSLFAALPLPDVDAAVAEAVHALDDLGSLGVAVMSNYDGVYLGDERFEPLWQALDERDATVFVHPTPTAALANLPGAAGWVDWPFDTTRTAVHLVVHGVVRRHPGVRFVLAHAGGFLPYQAGRFEALASITPGLDEQQVADDLRRFHVDTALSATPATLAALQAFGGVERVLFGTDWPAAPDVVAERFTRQLDEFTGADPLLAAAIDHGNAERLFARRLP